MTFPAYDRELAVKANERARRAEQRVKELEDGIREHREAVMADVTCCDECRQKGKSPAYVRDHERALWRLLDGSDDR